MSKATDKEADELARGADQPVNPAGSDDPLSDEEAARVAVDTEQLPFDPDVHKTLADRSPLVQKIRGKDGTWIYRLQRKPGRKVAAGTVGKPSRVAPGSPPGEPKDGAEKAESGGGEPKGPTLGAVLTLILERFGTAACQQEAAGGPPWGGHMEPIERQGIAQAVDRYAAANGGDIPPGVAILLLGGQYLYRVNGRVEEIRAARKAKEIQVQPGAGVKA